MTARLEFDPAASASSRWDSYVTAPLAADLQAANTATEPEPKRSLGAIAILGIGIALTVIWCGLLVWGGIAALDAAGAH